MSDSSLLLEKLIQIEDALQRISRRFYSIKSPEDFLDTDKGTDMLDGIGMMLIAIGENLKKIDYETNGELLKQYPSVNWRGAKGVRDILSHHYFNLDAAQVFDICEDDIPELMSVIDTMIKECRTK